MKRITLKAVLLLLCIVTVLSAVTVTNASSSDQTVTLSLDGQVQNDEKSVTVSVTDGGLMISPSVDVNGQIASIVYTQEECEKAMKSLAACGFERVYFVVSQAGIPALCRCGVGIPLHCGNGDADRRIRRRLPDRRAPCAV